MIEVPPAGMIHTNHIIRPFKPRMDETRQELDQTYADYVCILIAGYIFFFVGYTERRHKMKYHKAGIRYYLSLNGICDLAIVIIVVVNVFLRWQFKSKKDRRRAGGGLKDKRNRWWL